MRYGATPSIEQLANEVAKKSREKNLRPPVVIDEVLRSLGITSTITRSEVLAELGRRAVAKRTGPKPSEPDSLGWLKKVPKPSPEEFQAQQAHMLGENE